MFLVFFFCGFELAEPDEIHQLLLWDKFDGHLLPIQSSGASVRDGYCKQSNRLIASERKLLWSFTRLFEQFPTHRRCRPKQTPRAQAHPRLESKSGCAESKRRENRTAGGVNFRRGLPGGWETQPTESD